MVLQGGGAIARLRRHHQNAPKDQGSNEKGGGGGITVGDVLINVRRIVVFILLAFVVYSPFGTHWINNPSSATLDGWDENRTSASWDTDMWDWDFIDCLYFAMCTMTTVGYGDMPTLRQEMRIFTLFFGFIGVTVVAGSITVIADWFAQQGRKRFLAKQRALLGQAILVAEGCAAHTLLTPSRRPRKLSNTGAICTYMYLLLHCFTTLVRPPRLPVYIFSVRNMVAERGGNPLAPAAADPADAPPDAPPKPPKRFKRTKQILSALRLTGCFFLTVSGLCRQCMQTVFSYSSPTQRLCSCESCCCCCCSHLHPQV